MLPEPDEAMVIAEKAPEPSGAVYPLGKYIVLAELGRGGMAEVYLGLSRGPSGFSKLVVLKLLRAHLAEDEEFLHMFLGEARLAARLNHANIVQTYEVGVEGGRPCIVMEYLEGCSMAQLQTATRKDGIPIQIGVRLLADALAGLHHAHERCDLNGQPLGLVHRDVSPHNLFVTHDGQVKVLDFGIAKATDDGARTKTGVFKGKLRYTAPERFCGEESDRRSDIFSVGVILWQLLTKRHLWSGMTELALMQQLASRIPIQSPRAIDPTIPEGIEAICMKAIAMSPAERFQTAAEMQDALEEYLATDPGGTNRALSRFMGEHFGEPRAQFQRVVDEQVRAAASLPLDAEVTSSVARMRAQGLPLLGSGDAASPHSASRVRADQADGPSESASPDLEWVEMDALAPFGRRQRTKAALWFGVGLLAILAALGACFAIWQPRSDRSIASVGPAPAASSGVAQVAAIDKAAALAAPPAPVASAVQAEAADVAPEITTAVKRVQTLPPFNGGRVQFAKPRSPSSANEMRSAPPATETEPQRREVECASPYYLDDQGMKRIRTECL